MFHQHAHKSSGYINVVFKLMKLGGNIKIKTKHYFKISLSHQEKENNKCSGNFQGIIKFLFPYIN